MAANRHHGPPGLSVATHHARPLLRLIQRIFTPLAVAFLLYVGWNSRQLLLQIATEATFEFLLLAALLWLIGHLILPLFTGVVLRGSSAGLTYRKAFLVHARRLPARYIPGGVWHTVSRVTDLKRLGASARFLTAFVALENALALVVTFALGGICLAFFFRGTAYADLGIVTAAGALLLMLLAPLVINRWVLRDESRLPLSAYLQALCITLLFWLVAAAAFVSYAEALPGVLNDNDPLQTGGIYLFSWAIGYLAVFAPQGIGVFEAVASQLLSTPLTTEEAILLIAGFRAVVLVADLTAWSLAELLARCSPSTT